MVLVRFEVGKEYIADYDMTGRYKGMTTHLGTAHTKAVCTKRTDKFVTFDVYNKWNGEPIEFRGKVKLWQTSTHIYEYVILKKSGYKEITIETWEYDIESVDTDSYIKPF